MSAERVEIHAELVESDGQMRNSLGSVAHDDCVGPFADDTDDVAHGVDRAEGIGDVIDGDDLRFRVYQSRQAIQVDAVIFGEVADAESRFLLDRELLPGDEVRVMLERGDYDLIAFANVRPAVGARDEVD